MSDLMLTAIVAGSAAEQTNGLPALRAYLGRAGLSHEILLVGDVLPGTDLDEVIRRTQPEGGGRWDALRRAVSEARGSVVAIIDGAAIGCVDDIGHAIALVEGEETDIVLGATGRNDDGERVARMFLRCDTTAARGPLRVYSLHAARLLFAESRLDSAAQPFEIVYLASRYGFRVRRIELATVRPELGRETGGITLIRDLVAVRRHERALAYRAPRRCPVCFSSSVRSAAQVPRHVVRLCERCKCSYLADLPSEDDLESSWSPPQEPVRCVSTRKTYDRQLRLLRRLVAPGGRILEVGAGDGSLGASIAAEYEYVGIDLSDANARRARAAGVPVYKSPLSRFVNTGTQFDAVVLFRVFEFLPDPHDALARLRELLKPGGYLLMVTPDNESLSGTVAAERWMREKFPEHVIVYSRSALIELLERSGFEIASAGAFIEYRDHQSLREGAARRGMAWAARLPLAVLPDPLPLSSGEIRIVARRRAGPPTVPRGIRSVEPTHAR